MPGSPLRQRLAAVDRCYHAPRGNRRPGGGVSGVVAYLVAWLVMPAAAVQAVTPPPSPPAPPATEAAESA